MNIPFRIHATPSGDVLQVSGEAHVVWAEDENSPVFPPGGSTGKHVRIDVLAVVEAKGAYPLRMRMKELSPFNPPLPANTKTSGLDGTGQQEEQRHNFVMRCKEVVDAASGVKSFRFEPAALVGAGDKGGDEKNKDPAWTPGQVKAFTLIVLIGTDTVVKMLGLLLDRGYRFAGNAF